MVGVQAGEGKRAERESQRDQAHGRHRLVDDGHHRHRERWAHEGDGLHRFSNARHFHTALDEVYRRWDWRWWSWPRWRAVVTP